MDLHTEWAALERPTSKRVEEGVWVFSPISDNQDHDCSPLEDFLMTSGAFLLGVIPCIVFLAWLLA